MPAIERSSQNSTTATQVDFRSSEFWREASTVLSRLRTSMADLIAALPGGAAIRKAADLDRALQLGEKASWQVFKVANSSDPLAASAFVPGAAPARRLLVNARKKGVSAEIVANVESAFANYDRLVHKYAGERKALDLMLSSIASDETTIAVEDRRDAYRANSRIWGVQARTRVNCFVFRPGSLPDLADAICIRGFVDVRWLRPPSLPFVIARSSSRTLDATAWDDPKLRQPLMPEDVCDGGVPLLARYSSQALPRIRNAVVPPGMLETELLPNDLGRASALTCFVGDVTRNVESLYRDEQNDKVQCLAPVRYPTEVLIHDVLICDGMYGNIVPEAFVISLHDDYHPGHSEEQSRLPMVASVQRLGRGSGVLDTPDVPRYAEMLHESLERLAWHNDPFDVYRCRIEYPVMPSIGAIEFDLPSPPEKPQ